MQRGESQNYKKQVWIMWWFCEDDYVLVFLHKPSMM